MEHLVSLLMPNSDVTRLYRLNLACAPAFSYKYQPQCADLSQS